MQGTMLNRPPFLFAYTHTHTHTRFRISRRSRLVKRLFIKVRSCRWKMFQKEYSYLTHTPTHTRTSAITFLTPPSFSLSLFLSFFLEPKLTTCSKFHVNRRVPFRGSESLVRFVRVDRSVSPPHWPSLMMIEKRERSWFFLLVWDTYFLLISIPCDQKNLQTSIKVASNWFH